jgi:hypothetical protein
VSPADQLLHTRRGHGNAVFVVLDFLGNSDQHFLSLAKTWLILTLSAVKITN